MYTRTYIPFLRTVQCALNNRIMSLHFGGRIRPDSIQTVIFRFSGRGSSIFQVKEVRGKSAHNHKPSAAKFKRLAISPSPPRLPSYTVCRVPRATSLKRATVQGLVVHAHLMNVHGLMVKVLPTRRLGRPPRRPQNDHRTTRRRGGRSTRRRPTRPVGVFGTFRGMQIAASRVKGDVGGQQQRAHARTHTHIHPRARLAKYGGGFTR